MTHCIHLWQQRLPFRVDFDQIFASFGTPLSDATEERQWRKLIHRATFVRGRDNRLTEQEQRCRMCNATKESMLHIIECRHAKPLWRTCLHFCHTVLGADKHTYITAAVIFGLWQPNVLGSTAARAFLRHAFGHFYRHLNYVDFNQQRFVWQRVYRDTLISFRAAALRYAGKLRLLHTRRLYTHQQDTAPREAYERFNAFMDIEHPQGHASFDPAYTDEIERIKQVLQTL